MAARLVAAARRDGRVDMAGVCRWFRLANSRLDDENNRTEQNRKRCKMRVSDNQEVKVYVITSKDEKWYSHFAGQLLRQTRNGTPTQKLFECCRSFVAPPRLG